MAQVSTLRCSQGSSLSVPHPPGSLKAIVQGIIDCVNQIKSPTGLRPSSCLLSFLHSQCIDFDVAELVNLLKNFMREDPDECSTALKEYIEEFCKALSEYAETQTHESLVIVVQTLELLDMIVVMYLRYHIDHMMESKNGVYTATFIIPLQMLSNSETMMLLAKAVEHSCLDDYYSLRQAFEVAPTFNIALLIKK